MLECNGSVFCSAWCGSDVVDVVDGVDGMDGVDGVDGQDIPAPHDSQNNHNRDGCATLNLRPHAPFPTHYAPRTTPHSPKPCTTED